MRSADPNPGTPDVGLRLGFAQRVYATREDSNMFARRLVVLSGGSQLLLGSMTEVLTEPVYAGFWPRLGAMLIDIFIGLPLALLSMWAEHEYRLFDVYR